MGREIDEYCQSCKDVGNYSFEMGCPAVSVKTVTCPFIRNEEGELERVSDDEYACMCRLEHKSRESSRRHAETLRRDREVFDMIDEYGVIY